MSTTSFGDEPNISISIYNTYVYASNWDTLYSDLSIRLFCILHNTFYLCLVRMNTEAIYSS